MENLKQRLLEDNIDNLVVDFRFSEIEDALEEMIERMEIDTIYGVEVLEELEKLKMMF